jgi:hypothetical protein
LLTLRHPVRRMREIGLHVVEFMQCAARLRV